MKRLDLVQRLALLAALLGCLAFFFAYSASRATTADLGPLAPLEFYQIGESKLLVIRAEGPLTDAELHTLAAKLNTNPLIQHDLAR